jgi:hypothetical protein
VDRSSIPGPEGNLGVLYTLNFELRWDCADSTTVFVLFLLVQSLLSRDGTSRIEANTEQVLAAMVPVVLFSRSVYILVEPLLPPP